MRYPSRRGRDEAINTQKPINHASRYGASKEYQILEYQTMSFLKKSEVVSNRVEDRFVTTSDITQNLSLVHSHFEGFHDVKVHIIAS
jgi:hypothetical protein